jgi:hypothetical protein
MPQHSSDATSEVSENSEVGLRHPAGDRPMETSPRRAYPRALPYRSPDAIAADAERQQEQMQDRLDDLAAQAGHLRRYTRGLSLALAAAVVLAVTLTVLLVRNPTTPAASPLTVDALPAAATPPMRQNAPPITATEPASRGVTLEALGGLSAANLYQSYLTIGLLADGVRNKAFTADGAANTLKIVTSCIALVDTKLARLDRLNLEPDDLASLRQIKAVIALMRIQTQALELYWSTGKADHAEAYQRARKATWAGLSKVLGIEGA